jgi:hypothetical protein
LAQALLLLPLAVVARSHAALPAESTPSLEWAIKATYLYKFAGFVEWPEGSFQSPSSPIVLCILGRDPFGSTLARALEGQAVNGRPFVLQHMNRATPATACHIAYVAGSSFQTIAQMLAQLESRPVLTVTDETQRRPAGSIINFTVDDNHVRFEIDSRPADRAGIVISSKLMTVAAAVYGAGQ